MFKGVKNKLCYSHAINYWAYLLREGHAVYMPGLEKLSMCLETYMLAKMQVWDKDTISAGSFQPLPWFKKNKQQFWKYLFYASTFVSKLSIY